MQDAQLYLSRVLPWDTIETTGAYVNLHWTVPGRDGSRPFWRGVPCRSPGDVIKQLQYVTKQSNTLDVYVCMSTQLKTKEITAKNGQPFKVAERSQADACMLKSLFADIDVKAGAYPTTKDAAHGIAKFLTESGLPHPTISVMSGSGGVHLYWTLERALTVAEWQPLADALAEALRRHGVHADTACTIDAARVLRVPETINKKVNKPVRLLPTRYKDVDIAVMRHALAPYMGARVVRLHPTQAQLGDDDLAAGIQRTARPVNLDSIAAAGCGFIREAIDTGGAAYANPLWNLSTLVAVFTEGEEADAHRMAQGHPTYDPQATTDLFDRKQRERTAKNLGWPQCSTIKASGCQHCGSCPLFQPNMSPLNYGKPTPPPTPTKDNDLPEGYVRDPATKAVQLLTQDSEGQSVNLPVCHLALYDGSLLEEPEVLRFKTDLGPFRIGREIQVPIEKISSKDGFNKVTGSQGMNIFPQDVQKVQKFLMSWISKLRTIKGASTKATPFGWFEDNGKVDGFCFAGKNYSVGKETAAAVADPMIMQHYKGQGDLDVWKIAASFITNQRRPDLDVILASAFAAPLVRFTGQRGVYISAYSAESGIGKTTTLQVAQAVWANPQHSVSMLDDTMNHVAKKLGELRALPVYWDEIKTDEQAKHIVTLIFQLTGGREKGRLQQDASFRRSGVWQTLLLSCSNDSIARHVERNSKTSVAGMMRVFEFAVTPKPSPAFTLSQASTIVSKVNSHYGRAGEVYSKWLGENHQKVAKMVEALSAHLDKTLQTHPEERLWSATVVSLVAGAKIANHLGLTNIDIKAMEDFLITQMSNMRNGVKTSTVSTNNPLNLDELLVQFIRDNPSNYIQTNTIWDTRGKPPPNTVKVENMENRITSARIQYIDDISMLRLSKAFFMDYVERKGMNPINVLDNLIAVKGAKLHRGRIGAGTPYSLPAAEWVLDIRTGATWDDKAIL